MIPSSKQRCVSTAPLLQEGVDDLRPWGADTKFSAAYFDVRSLKLRKTLCTDLKYAIFQGGVRGKAGRFFALRFSYR